MYTIIFTMHNVYDKYKCGTREWHIWYTIDIDRIPPYFHIVQFAKVIARVYVNGIYTVVCCCCWT